MIRQLNSIRNFLNSVLFHENFFIAVLSLFCLGFTLTVFSSQFFFQIVGYFDSAIEQNWPSKNYSMSFYRSVFVAPIFESILLVGVIFFLRKLKFSAFWVIVFPALFLALLHIPGHSLYHPLRVFASFALDSYVFFYSLKICTTLGATCRIAASHMLHNFCVFAVVTFL
jgi:hypothetical protein